MIILGISLLVFAPILLLVALGVRFAGNRKALNSIDYSTIVDREGLHQWAGNRLFLLPVAAGLFGAFSLSRPMFGVLGWLVVILIGIVVWIWIATASDRFRPPPKGSSD